MKKYFEGHSKGNSTRFIHEKNSPTDTFFEPMNKPLHLWNKLLALFWNCSILGCLSFQPGQIADRRLIKSNGFSVYFLFSKSKTHETDGFRHCWNLWPIQASTTSFQALLSQIWSRSNSLCWLLYFFGLRCGNENVEWEGEESTDVKITCCQITVACNGCLLQKVLQS